MLASKPQSDPVPTARRSGAAAGAGRPSQVGARPGALAIQRGQVSLPRKGVGRTRGGCHDGGMQRLFSAFPFGRPGVALLLLRGALGVLLLDGMLGPLGTLDSIWVLLAPCLLAASLWAGFMTPAAAVLCVLLELATWLSGLGSFQAVHLCATLDAVALMLLGPGAYSVDARLFGRRKIVLPPDDESRGQ